MKTHRARETEGEKQKVDTVSTGIKIKPEKNKRRHGEALRNKWRRRKKTDCTVKTNPESRSPGPGRRHDSAQRQHRVPISTRTGKEGKNTNGATQGVTG